MPKIDKLVTVKLDKVRHLRLAAKGMVEFEKITGKNLLKGLNLDEMTIGDEVALMWACMIHEDKELTYDDVLDMVDLSNINIVDQAVTDCINQSLPDIKEVKPPPLAKKSRAG